jgi:hypothetical protein
MSYRENQHHVSLTTELPVGARLGMFCEEKVLLMANYGAASTAYYASVSKLEQGMIRGSRETYAGLRQSVEIARIICEAALKELDDHVFTDGC